jgi:hypothetical protein
MAGHHAARYASSNTCGFKATTGRLFARPYFADESALRGAGILKHSTIRNC